MTDIFAGLICRPPRKEYVIEDLGPSRYLLHEQMCVRQDLELLTRRKMKIKCSHYLPVDSDSLKVVGKVPCVVYLHGNSGSRMDADDMVDTFLAEKISVFSIDFAGCGMSDGDFVTLGWREREDLEAVLNHLDKVSEVSHVALYGRSMGAATAMLVASDERFYHRVVGMVLDSCYTSVRQVLLELAKKYVGKVPLVPFEAMIEPAVDMLRHAVISRAGFDIDKIDVLQAARHCAAPVLFGHAADDQLVLASHTRNLYKNYGGPKEINVFEGDHNSIRPQEFRDQSLKHLRKCFAEAGVETRPEGPGHISTHSGGEVPTRAKTDEPADGSGRTGSGWSLFGLGAGFAKKKKISSPARASTDTAVQRPSPSPPPLGAGGMLPGVLEGALEGGGTEWKEHVNADDFASAPRTVADTPDKNTAVALRSAPRPPSTPSPVTPTIPSPVKKGALHSAPPLWSKAGASGMNGPPTPSASLAPPHAANEGPSGSSEAAALAQTDNSQQATPPTQTPAAGGAASTHAASGRQGAADPSYALYSKPETLNSPPAHSAPVSAPLRPLYLLLCSELCAVSHASCVLCTIQCVMNRAQPAHAVELPLLPFSLF